MIGKPDGQQVLGTLQPAQQCVAMRAQRFCGLGDIAAIGQEGVQRALKHRRLRRQPPQGAQDELPGRAVVLGHQRHHPHLVDGGNGGCARQAAHQPLRRQGLQMRATEAIDSRARGRLREGAESYAKALASDILR